MHWVHGLGTALPGDVNQLVDGKIGLGGAAVAKRPGFIGVLNVGGVAVGLGVDRDRSNAKAL